MLSGDSGEIARTRIDRQFEDRPLRLAYVEAIASAVGTADADALLHRAARERVAAMVNAWRNAPIQGTVADIMLAAYADLELRLRRYPGTYPVQTVHDSLVVECHQRHAHDGHRGLADQGHRRQLGHGGLPREPLGRLP